MVGSHSDSFTYDQANRLKSATIGGATSTYAYDGDGKRTSKTVGTNTTSYVYDVNRSLPVVLDDGGRKYVWGLGLAYAVDTSDAIEVSHTDGLGSVRTITDAAASVVQTYQTDEFGVPTQTQDSSTQPFQYTGEPRDAESGFVYLRARVYDRQIGRFLSRDPKAGLLTSPTSLNRFTYALNNPVNRTDPSGLDTGGPLDLGLGWSARIDTFNERGQATYEIHVFNSQGKNVGIDGSNGWIARHGFSGARPEGVPDAVIDRLNGLNVDLMRRHGLIGPKGTQNIKHLGRILRGAALSSVVLPLVSVLPELVRPDPSVSPEKLREFKYLHLPGVGTVENPWYGPSIRT